MLRKSLVACLLVPAVACGLGACSNDSNNAGSKDTKTVTVTASTVTLQPGTWEYIQNHYSGYLALTCDPQQPTAGYYSACIGLQNASIEGFKNDVSALPQSKFQTDLLVTIVTYIAAYRNYVNAMCPAMDPTQPPCFDMAKSLRDLFSIMGGIVNRAVGR
ncbi:hypothetical protein [Mycobacterium sp. TY815]|uniref:hypothetical protein n=1 Tax=Mycobacterium sp. TY815 TaxID=3050581 RepID=UPI00274132F4|nr:hypothetical protein [Mycobacterium sp. TY815]MDP7707412.1 hypothetical protein [Mycobacterium sp. TY815]